MSPTKLDTTLQAASASRDSPPSRLKAVLICPECAHEGHATADWTARDDYVAGTRAIVCPECGTTVTQRPLPTRSANRTAREGVWSETGLRMPWETWRDLWCSSLSLVTNWPDEARC